MQLANFPQLRHVLGIVFVACFLSHCSSEPVAKLASPPKVSGVLEEVNAPKETQEPQESKGNPLVANISEKLKALGYEALGLSFETDETLLLLGNVFDSPIAQNRKIKIIYTGLLMSYDAKHQSLTLSTSKNLATILSFIDKNVPKQVQEVAAPAPQVAPSSPGEPEPSNLPPTASSTKKLKGKLKGRVKLTGKLQRKTKKKTQRNLPKVKSAPAPIAEPSLPVPPTTIPPATTTTQPTEPSASEPEALPQDKNSEQEVPQTENVQEPDNSASEPSPLMPEEEGREKMTNPTEEDGSFGRNI